MRDHTGGMGSADHIQRCAEYSAQCVADALEDSHRLIIRLATALRRAEELEQSDAKLEGLDNIVTIFGDTLERSGVAPSEVTAHVEASGLADAASNTTCGTRICVHGYAAVASELA